VFNIFAGIFLILFAIATYTSGTFSPYWGVYDFELGLLKYPLSISIFTLGVYIMINYKNTRIRTDEDYGYYTICPNCKETFNYDELKNGKCKYCEDVDTVDIEQYYKDNPEEKDEK